MTRTVSRQRTIALYQVRASTPQGSMRLDSQDWQQRLLSWESMTAEDCMFELDGSDYLCTVLLESGRRHLLLHRFKDRHEWMSRIDRDAGVLEQLEADDVRNFVETSAATFAGFDNVVAFMEGGVSSPSRRVLEAWLAHVSGTGVEVLVVEALRAAGRQDVLEDAVGVQSIEIKIGRISAAALEEKQGRLASVLRAVKTADYGDGYSWTLKLTGPRTSSTSGARRAKEGLRDDVQEVLDVLPASDRARVGAIYETDNGRSWTGQRIHDLVEHNITMKVMVSVFDDKGEVIQARGAVAVMTRELKQMEAELREITGDVGREAG